MAEPTTEELVEAEDWIKRVDGGEAQRRDLAAHDVLGRWIAKQAKNKKEWWKLVPGVEIQEGGVDEE
jgi:hypothetical protein